jgi:hypothetical protein
MRKSPFVMFVIATMLVAGAAIAGDWSKLGRKAVSFNGKERPVSITAKGDAVSQIAFKVGGGWVKLSGITINFDDGTTQAFENTADVRPGMISDSITVDDGPKVVTSIDLSCRSANSSQQGRATITALGQ